MLAAILIINPFKKTVTINGVVIKNDKYIKIEDAVLSVREVKDLAKLDKCENLLFKNCTFEAGASKNISDSKTVYHLSIVDCTGIDDLSFLNDMMIVYLEIANCGLTDKLMNGISLPDSMKDLKLPSNNLTYVPKADKVLTLEMPDNAVSVIDNMAAMTSLASVDLSGNEIKDISALKDDTKIKVLNLNNNQIEIIDAMTALVYLENLYLGGNNICDLSPLKYCSELKMRIPQERSGHSAPAE